MVKKYLTLKNVEYQEVDVSEDANVRDTLFKLTGMTTVPVTTRGEDFVVGFKPALLAKFAA